MNDTVVELFDFAFLLIISAAIDMGLAYSVGFAFAVVVVTVICILDARR